MELPRLSYQSFLKRHFEIVFVQVDDSLQALNRLREFFHEGILMEQNGKVD